MMRLDSNDGHIAALIFFALLGLACIVTGPMMQNQSLAEIGRSTFDASFGGLLIWIRKA